MPSTRRVCDGGVYAVALLADAECVLLVAAGWLGRAVCSLGWCLCDDGGVFESSLVMEAKPLSNGGEESFVRRKFESWVL